ncbi:MAG: hypothetical protein ABIK79_08485 [Chloroflexota bacterium]
MARSAISERTAASQHHHDQAVLGAAYVGSGLQAQVFCVGEASD